MAVSVDIQAGIANCGGEKDFYMEILEEFIEEGKIEEMDQAFNDKDWELYTIDVHSVKGSLRLFGANETGDLAEELQFAGEKKDIATIEAKHGELMKEIEEVIQVIRAGV